MEKEGAMGKTKRISLKPILVLVQRTKKDLKKGRKFVPAAQKKAFDARIKALGKAENLLMFSCKGGMPPLSIIVPGGH